MTNNRLTELVANLRGAIADIKLHAQWCEVLAEEILAPLISEKPPFMLLNLRRPSTQAEWDKLYPTILAHDEATFNLEGICRMLYRDMGDVWDAADKSDRGLLAYKNEYGDFQFPAWQLGPDRKPLPGLYEVLIALTKQGICGRDAMEYLLRGKPGRRPLDKLRRGEKVRFRNGKQ